MSTTTEMARRRNEAIARLGVLHGAGDPALTALTRLVAYVTGAASAAVHVLDDLIQHRIAAHGAPLGPHALEDAMCRLVVDSEQRLVCADATTDPRLAFSSFVRGPQPVRFYVSVPVRDGDATVVGTLCAWDTVPRRLSADQLDRLDDLVDQLAARLELTRLAAELGHAASHDSLTGASNRLVLSDRLAQAFARQQRHGTDVLVALVDIDGFKLINDTHGHEAGDEVLIAVAGRLRESVRAEDTVARIGGDEFVVVAESAAGRVSAGDFAARIEALLCRPLAYGGGLRPLKVTVGAAMAGPGDDVRSALARADAAMYERKPGLVRRVDAPALPLAKA